MQVARKVAMGAAAALALTGAGCAQFIEQLQAAQAAQSGGDPAATKSRQVGIAAAAEGTQDAVVLARIGDDFRNMMPRADYVAAHNAYRKALELEPRNTYVLVAQATAYLRQGSDEKFSNPDGSATSDANRLRLAEKYFKRAKTLAEKAIKVNPNYGTAHFVIGEMYALLGDYPKALETFDRIEKQNMFPEGHKSTFYAWRGFVKKVNGDEAGSKADLEAAIEFSEPIEFGEYADKILNPVQGPEAQKGPGPDYRAIVHAL